MATYKDVLMLVDKVSQPLKKIGENTEKTTKKMQKLTDKLKNFGKGFQNLGGKIVAFGKRAVGAFVAIGAAVTAVGGAILRGANKYAEMGDRIDKMSQKIGMGAKAFQEWDYIMSQNGGNVESLQMGFKTLVTQIEGVQKGSKDSIKAFKALGVSVKDNNGKFRKADDVFNDTVRALQKIKDPTQKMILANRLFGRSAAELRPLLNQEAEAIDNLREKANKMGLILSEEDIKNAVKYKDTMDTFSRFFEAKFASVMMKIMPDLTKALEEIMEIVSENQQVFNDIGQVFKWLAGTALPATIKAVVWFVNAIRTVLVDFPMSIAEAITGFSMSIYGAFMKVKTFITTTFISIGKAIGKVAEYIGQVFNNVIENIRQWLMWIIEKITWLIGKIPILGKLFNGVSSIVRQTQNNNTTNNNTSITNNYGNTYNNGYNNMFPLSNVPLTT